MLEEKFTEDELRQVIAVMGNPAWIEFQQLGPDMQKPLMEKLMAESRALIEPEIKALEQSIARRLGVRKAPAARAKPPVRQRHQPEGPVKGSKPPPSKQCRHAAVGPPATETHRACRALACPFSLTWYAGISRLCQQSHCRLECRSHQSAESRVSIMRLR